MAAAGLAILRETLRPGTIVRADDALLVTETGFITMAVLPRRTVRLRDLIVTPGADDVGRCGHLVLRPGHPPFHSLQRDAMAAVDEALLNQRRAADLVAAFGDRDGLRRAARAAPWHLRSVFADTERAGLCRWGSVSFLERMRLRRVAMTVGLPRAALRMAGSYGERVTAATLLRREAATGRSACEQHAR